MTTQLSVSLTHSANAASSQIAIGGQGVAIGPDGKGTTQVEAGAHNFTVWLIGPPGATATYSIDSAAKNYTKGSFTVAQGHSTAVAFSSFVTP